MKHQDVIERFREKFHQYEMDDPRDVILDGANTGEVEDFIVQEIDQTIKEARGKALRENALRKISDITAYPNAESRITLREWNIKMRAILDHLIEQTIKEERKRVTNIVLRSTEIPKGARNPTRDAVVVMGEKLVDLINQEE